MTEVRTLSIRCAPLGDQRICWVASIRRCSNHCTVLSAAWVRGHDAHGVRTGKSILRTLDRNNIRTSLVWEEQARRGYPGKSDVGSER
jgi:hypothetical protein